MKLVFCGTPEFAVSSLEAVLDAGHEVGLVLTQPDRPSGRRLELQAPPVKQVALARGVSVAQPERIKRNLELQQQLTALAPDAILVVAYGRIIPEWMLQLPRFGNLNLHGSLLPKYRGAAPIQWAVANGETETGVTTMRLDAGLDTGDVLLEERVPLDPATTSAELFPRLASVGAALLLKTLDGLAAGTIHPKPQDHTRATLAPILTRDDGKMRPESQTAQILFNHWRGFYPWPGAWASFRGKRFLVHRMSLPPTAPTDALKRGELRLIGGELLLGAANSSLVHLAEVQLEGKPRMAGADFARGFQLREGEHLA